MKCQKIEKLQLLPCSFMPPRPSQIAVYIYVFPDSYSKEGIECKVTAVLGKLEVMTLLTCMMAVNNSQ